MLLTAGPAAADAVGDADRVSALPTLGPVAEPQFAGYASTSSKSCSDLLCSAQAGLFYWLVGRAPDYQTQPTILWSNGGPGSSSFYGFFSENGPYTVNPSTGLVPYADSWSHAANYLIFDHPLGVGLSFPFGGRYARNVHEGIDQLHQALRHVVERRGLERSPIFLTGESYGGTYVPLLAERILDANKRTRNDIKLGGIVIVSGWVDPLVHVSTTADYALGHGLITAGQKVGLDRILAKCRRALRGPPPSSVRAGVICQSIQSKIATLSGRYLANIAQASDIDYDPIEAYLNRPDVRQAIHAQPGGVFSLSSDKIYKLYARGGMDSYRAVVGKLLERGVPVMVISGLNDAKDVNVLGTRKWLNRLRWDGAKRFRRASTTRWKSDGIVLGYSKSGGGLTFLTALSTGHLAPRDQPKLIERIQQFMASRR